MLSKMNATSLVAQCWYLKRHVPVGRRTRDEDGALHCTCRYCQRPIRSYGDGHWDIDEGFDIDALTKAGMSGYFCVVDLFNDMVIARYMLPEDRDDSSLAVRLAEIREKHGLDEQEEPILEIRIIQGAARDQSMH